MNSTQYTDEPSCWPALPLASWQDTYATLHMWTQIVGKIRMSLTPLVNHWWNVPLYVASRGLTTSRIPYGERSFELWFDFIRHQLMLETSDGAAQSIRLEPQCVADFYKQCMMMLQSAGIHVKIWPVPVEIADPIPFEQDRTHCSYDSQSVTSFWRNLQSVDAVLQCFRARFIGKSSPVHFFWGSFDLALTRFSGRKATERAGADSITREAYSHEVSSVGFWPGGGNIAGPAFYSYMAPEPQGYRDARVLPSTARYDTSLNEFILMHDDIRSTESPSAALLDFCQSTYEAGANAAGWDRRSLERQA